MIKSQWLRQPQKIHETVVLFCRHIAIFRAPGAWIRVHEVDEAPHSLLFVSLLDASFLFDNYAHSSLVPGHSLLTHCPGEARKRKDVRTSLSIALDDAHRGSTFHRANNARDLAAGFHITRENSRNIW